MEKPSQSLRQQIEHLTSEGYARAEIVERVPSLAPDTVYSYIKEYLKTRSKQERATIQAKRDARPVCPKTKGGQTPFAEKSPLGALHRRVGVRLYEFRNKADLSKTQFVATYGFSNRVRLSQMEQGFHEFTLSELQLIAEMIGVEVWTLLQPVVPSMKGKITS